MCDDLFGKKKDVAPVLDLSKSVVANKEELKRLMEKVPDYRMRPVKVRSEDIKIKDKDWSFKCPRKEVKALVKSNGTRERSYTYLDPIPSEMKGCIKISDLCLVPIDWKMLTTLRPKSKVDEDFFSKLVEVLRIAFLSLLPVIKVFLYSWANCKSKRNNVTNETISSVPLCLALLI